MLSLTNHGSRKKFCRDAHTISVDAEIDELDPSEFEMDGDHLILPVFFHNMKGFDSHIIMTYIDTNFAPSDIHIIPTTSEKYISFQYRQSQILRFVKILERIT